MSLTNQNKLDIIYNNSIQPVYKDQIYSDSDLIPSIAPSGMINGEIRGVIQYYKDLSLDFVVGSSTAFYNHLIKDTIPFNQDPNGSYSYILKDSLGNEIPMNDWLLDVNTGIINFYNNLPENLPLSISFYKYVGRFGFVSVTGSTNDNIQIDANDTGLLFSSGGTISSTNRVLTVSGLTLSVDRWTNYQLRITSGTGIGQRRRIIANSTTTITVERDWIISPDNTSVFAIYGDTNKIYLAGNAQSSLYQYSIEEDIWTESSTFDNGLVRQASCLFSGQEAFGITTATRNIGSITGINPVPTVAGSGYVVGDILTISTGGTLGKVIVTSVSSTGAVLGLELFGCGLTYTIGTGKATTGGTGTLCTVEITTVSVVGRITLASNHNLMIGETVLLSGFTEALWNSGYTIIGCDAANVFDVATTATATGVVTTALTTTNIVDSTKNWIPDEHVGRLVTIQTAGTSPTTQI